MSVRDLLNVYNLDSFFFYVRSADGCLNPSVFFSNSVDETPLFILTYLKLNVLIVFFLFFNSIPSQHFNLRIRRIN